MNLVAVDAGRAETKVVTVNGEPFSFPSRVARYFKPKGFNPLQEKTDLVLKVGADGDRYFIGGVVERVKRAGKGRQKQENKANQNTLLLTLAALSLACTGDRVKVVTGLPLHRFNESDRKEIKDLLTGTFDVYAATRHTPEEDVDTGRLPHRRFTIEEVIVTVEGAGAFFAHPRPGLVRVVDLGSVTCNCLTFRDKRFIHNESESFAWGWDTVEETEQDPEEVAEALHGELSGIWQDNEGATILLAGGVAEQLVTPLQRRFPEARVEALPRAQFANAEGYLEAAKGLTKNGQ